MSLLKPCEVSSQYPDWAGLPNDILGLILEKLPLLSDCVHFIAVCNTWRLAFLENRRKIESTCLRAPLLLVPAAAAEHRRNLFCAFRRKFVEPVLVPPQSKLVGSSHGWVVVIDQASVISLINPFTGGLISLPPLFGRPFGNVERLIRKVVLSADPHLDPRDYMVIALHKRPFTSLAMWKPGDTAWTHLCVDDRGAHMATVNCNLLHSNESAYSFSDVIIYQGQICIVDTMSRLVMVDCSLGSSKLQVKIIKPKPEILPCCTYLVESISGDLLLVQRYFVIQPHRTVAETMMFRVFKFFRFPLGTTRPKWWVEMNSLGRGEVLFLGVSHSMSLTASLFPGCQPNSIYYTSDCTIRIPGSDSHRLFDCGIFDLEHGSISGHYIPDSSCVPLPVWILPTMRGI